MNNTLAIIGAGQLGQQIANIALSDAHFQQVVFFDDFAVGSTTVNGHRIIATTKEILVSYQKQEFDSLAIGIGYKHMDKREEFFLKFRDSVPFATIIHTSCIIDKTAKIGTGSILYPGSIIDMNVELEENCIINLGCIISHDSLVGAHSFLAPGVALAGFIKIGKKCFLGINSTIIDNIEIVPRTTIGGGSLIIKNILTRGIYVGAPAHRIK